MANMESAADGDASLATALKKPRVATAESVEATMHAAIDSIESRFATTGSAALAVMLAYARSSALLALPPDASCSHICKIRAHMCHLVNRQ